MKLTIVNETEFARVLTRATKNLKILEEFIALDVPVARVDDHCYTSPYIAAHSLNESVKRFKKPIVKAVCRKGATYLVRTDKI